MHIFWLENLKGRVHSKDLGVDGKIILEWILGKQSGKMWTDVSRSGNGPWWALVNMVINLLAPQKAGNFLTSWVTICFSRTLLHVVN